MATAETNEPTVLSRLERLDILMGYLEEIKGSRRMWSSCVSTTSSEMTATSDGGNSSVNSSPKSLQKRCRPMDDVVVEAQLKGSLVDRVHLLEIRLLKLGEEIERERKREEEGRSPRSGEKKKHGNGLKRLVKSCVKGKTKE